MSGAGYDVAIVGAGPAGLAVAIESARRGLATVVLERSSGPPDKACGEGLMPRGVTWLEAAGVRPLLGPADCTPIETIRWIEADGRPVEGRLPAPGALGVRRTALTAALARRAAECGAELSFGCPVRRHARTAEGVALQTDGEEVRAALLVAADGLHSPIRRAAGLDRPLASPRRFGLRRHFRIAPWGRAVEVHLRPGIEAFVTPAGDRRIGIAFLWEPGAVGVEPDFDAFLALFPRVAERVGDSEPDSDAKGAGPFAQRCRTPVADRLVLVGDAAGFEDAITAEGVTLAFSCAAALGRLLPGALAQGATKGSLEPFAREFESAFRRHASIARTMLALSRHPRLRRGLTRSLCLVPRVVDRLMKAALS